MAATQNIDQRQAQNARRQIVERHLDGDPGGRVSRVTGFQLSTHRDQMPKISAFEDGEAERVQRCLAGGGGLSRDLFGR